MGTGPGPWLAALPHLPRLLAVLNRTWGELVAATTGDPDLRAILCAMNAGTPSCRAAALIPALMLRHYLDGAWYPRGGSGALCDALVAVLRKQGGEVRCEAPVECIRREGAGFAVRSAGTEVRARAVVCNAHPSLLYGDLLDPSLVRDETRRGASAGRRDARSGRARHEMERRCGPRERQGLRISRYGIRDTRSHREILLVRTSSAHRVRLRIARYSSGYPAPPPTPEAPVLPFPLFLLLLAAGDRTCSATRMRRQGPRRRILICKEQTPVRRHPFLACAPLTTVLSLAVGACDPDYWGPGFQDFYGAPLGWEAGEDPIPLTVAVVASSVDRDPEVNVARMLAVLDDLATKAPDTRLVLFGETSLGWYYDEEDPEGYQRSIAQAIPGPATDAIGAWTLEHGWTVAFGLAEDREGVIHNSLAVLDPEGEVSAVHAKVNLTDWDVESGFEPGEGATLMQSGELAVGLMICSDFESRTFIEAMDALNPDLVLLPLASGMGSDIDPTARQLEAWVLAANRYGDEGGVPYDGAVWISNPAGSHAATSTGAAGWISTRVEVPR